MLDFCAWAKSKGGGRGGCDRDGAVESSPRSLQDYQGKAAAHHELLRQGPGNHSPATGEVIHLISSHLIETPQAAVHQITLAFVVSPLVVGCSSTIRYDAMPLLLLTLLSWLLPLVMLLSLSMLLARFFSSCPYLIIAPPLTVPSSLPSVPSLPFPSLQADNAGFDATDLLNRLRQKHARDGEAGKWFGVDVDTEGEENVKEKNIGAPIWPVMISSDTAARSSAPPPPPSR